MRDSSLDIQLLKEPICLVAYSHDDREDLKTSVRFLINEAYVRQIVPSYIDFNLTAKNEFSVTLYGYPRIL
jgi:hypothetical protein